MGRAAREGIPLPPACPAPALHLSAQPPNTPITAPTCVGLQHVGEAQRQVTQGDDEVGAQAGLDRPAGQAVGRCSRQMSGLVAGGLVLNH